MELREIVSSVGLPLGAAVLGSVATASGTRSLWYERLEKPAYQPPSVVVAGALAASTADLARTAGRASRAAGGLLVPYAAWTTFATVLTAGIWRRNRH